MNGNGRFKKSDDDYEQMSPLDLPEPIISQPEFKLSVNPSEAKLSFIKTLALHVSLFLLTFFSTWYTAGLWYAIAIMTILLAHEMGHYLMCRRYHIRATLPYFIPFPLRDFNPFGTLGAVIKIGERLPTRKSIFDIGVAGPLSGLFFTIPILLLGLKLSSLVETNTLDPGMFHLGESFLFAQFSKLMIGEIPDGYEILLHPLAYAGWVGLFVTALNLLPIGQLDGGHVMYALFGNKSSKIVKYILALFAIYSAIFYWGWTIFIILIISIGYRHPPAVYNNTTIDTKRKIIGYATLLIFIISFTPIPFYFTF
ncbi:site-2 protease family protein [candidate division KSB1 bacterium]|nr:site-2 protease family protein [candidate division KSB1 bacterium]